jgi:2-polyprenyl-6-methoxyphenol hydroxylase-like FAD-dependent oxidoreductase
MSRVLVVGAGIGGLATAIALRPTGFETVVFERANDLKRLEVGAGITLWPNAVRALDRLGVGEDVRARGAVLHRFEQRTRRGRLLSRWALDEMGARLGAPVIGINRPDLHAILSAAGSYCVQTGSEVTGFEQHDSAVSLTFADGRSESGAVLIGADGIKSVIRAQLLGKQAPRHSGLTMWRANLELPERSMPPVPFLAFWGRGTKFVIYHAGPGLLSWEAIVASESGGSDATGDRKRVVSEHFAGFCDPVLPLVEATDEAAIFRTDVCDRPPIDRWGTGRVTLLGDAAHPMTFAVGQGAAQALEDSVAISAALETNGDVEAALRSYEMQRISRSAHFQTLAWRLAQIGVPRSRLRGALRNAFIFSTSRIGRRMQVKDMAERSTTS